MDNFELLKFKLRDGGAEVRYREKEERDGVEYVIEHNVKTTAICTAELYSLIDHDLRDAFADIFGIEPESVEVDEVAFAGKDEMRGVTLSGICHTNYGGGRLRAPKVRWLIGQLDVHAKLTTIVPKFEAEVKAYLEGNTEPLEDFIC